MGAPPGVERVRPMTETCPSDETLAAFLEGGLNGSARAAVEAHVRACASCAELVGQLPRGPEVGGKAEERYELSTVLGSGGMGDVLKAWDRTLQRWVALKLMRAPDPEMER